MTSLRPGEPKSFKDFGPISLKEIGTPRLKGNAP